MRSVNKKVICITAMLLSILAVAQIKPGGTSLEVELWLKADTINVANGGNVTSWNDISGKNRHYVQNGTNPVPTFDKVNLMNFQPSIKLASGNSNRKLINNTNFVASNKSYYVFYVSENLSQTTTRGIVYALESGSASAYTGVGWRYGNPFSEVRSNEINLNSNPRRMFGINASYFPNGTNPNLLFHNASQLATSSARTLTANMEPSIIGNHNLSTGYPFFGNIQEIIVLSSTAGSLIDPTELQKVQSYLSLKYGISLDASAQANYLNSAGNLIWDNSIGNNSNYRNHIFGIGRDSQSGLYQKQSESKTQNNVTVFLDNLSPTNTENSGALIDNTFLLFGSNNLLGITNYEYAAGTSFAESTSLSIDINRRTRSILKAQTYNQPSLVVNFRSNVERFAYLLVSTDEVFTPANTRAYLFDSNGIANNIRIDNNNYISFAYFLSAPGGVTDGLRLWLDANEENIDMVNNDVEVWRDLSIYENDYSYASVSYTGKTHPKHITCDPLMNFNPSIDFDITSYLAINQGPMSIDAPMGFTSFTVYHATAFASNDRLYTHGFGGSNPRSSSTRFPAMGFAPRDGVGRLRNDGAGQTNNDGNLPGFHTGTTALQMISTTKANGVSGAGYTIHDFGGWQDVVSSTGYYGDGFHMAQGGTIGGASISDASFQGRISEVFFYEKTLTPIEQNKIRSYLGMKYGITLNADQDNPLINYNYILSDNVTSVWNGNISPNNGYHNNVAGLVSDKAQHLNISKSKSTAKNAIVTMSLKGAEKCGSSREILDNLHGLFWGNNNGTFTPENQSSNPNLCGEMDETLTGPNARIWLTENTNPTNSTPVSPKTVTLSVSGGDFPFDGSGYEVFLLVADSDSKLKNHEWDQIIPMTFIDGEHQLNYTFSEEYTYFTFGAKLVQGNCDRCEFSGTKRLEFLRDPGNGSRGNWINGQLNRTMDLGDDFTVNVSVTLEAPSVWSNRYPRASSLRSLKEYRRRGNGDNIMQTEISLSKAAAVNFEIFEIDRSYTRYDDIEVYGMCAQGIVKPKLSYVTNPDKSSYEITNNFANAIRKTSSYTKPKGRMYVEFERAVEKIYVKHKYNGSPGTGRKRIGIGPMEFVCPAPLPEPTEDGLIFVKQGSTDVFLCEEVDYTFRVINTNCEPYPVNFSDILPTGMIWVSETLSIDDTAIANAIINEYGETNTLSIQNLEIPGGGSTFTFRAKAAFEMTATEGYYANRANIEYASLLNPSVIRNLQSCDKLTLGCEPTITHAVNSERLEPIQTLLTTDKNCYKAEEEITATLTVTNNNATTITDAILDFSFDDNLTYIANSLISTIGNITVEVEDNTVTLEDFSLPTGTYTFTFKLKAPIEADLLYIGTDLLPIPLTIDYSLDSDSEDICLGSATYYANGEVEIPFCNFCTKPPVGGDAELSSIGISTFKDQISGWPQNVANGFLVLESSSKGLVLTRTKASDIPSDKLVEGMIIFDTEEKCIRIYNGVEWNCIKRACNE